jgi:uncharacterized membrane protein
MEFPQHLNDEQVEKWIAMLLRAGVLVSALVVLAGAVPYLGLHPRARINYRSFHGQPEELKSVAGILRLAVALKPRGIMQLGLLLLISTPIARVLISALAFALEKDRMYVLFTLLVLAVLLYSLFGSFLIA